MARSNSPAALKSNPAPSLKKEQAAGWSWDELLPALQKATCSAELVKLAEERRAAGVDASAFADLLIEMFERAQLSDQLEEVFAHSRADDWNMEQGAIVAAMDALKQGAEPAEAYAVAKKLAGREPLEPAEEVVRLLERAITEEIAADTGAPSEKVRAQTNWSLVVAVWERQKALERERAARSDEEAHAAEDTPEEYAAVKAYWEALDALEAATPPGPAELAYQIREQLNASAFHYTFQHAECPDSISDLLSSNHELVATTYLSALRMAGIESPALEARRGVPFVPSDEATGAAIKAEWQEHHAMRRAVYTALGADRGVKPPHHQVVLTIKWAEDSGLSPEDVARCHLSPEAFDAYVDSLRKHQPAPAFGVTATQPEAAVLMAAE